MVEYSSALTSAIVDRLFPFFTYVIREDKKTHQLTSHKAIRSQSAILLVSGINCVKLRATQQSQSPTWRTCKGSLKGSGAEAFKPWKRGNLIPFYFKNSSEGNQYGFRKDLCTHAAVTRLVEEYIRMNVDLGIACEQQTYLRSSLLSLLPSGGE